jgi:hypothetical protein
MPVSVSFCRPRNINSAPVFGRVLSRESLDIDETTAGAANSGDSALIYNGTDAAVLLAHGTAPDAAATAANGVVTSAGYALGAGQSMLVILEVGDKINVKPFS